jgi:hypothetical protein
MFRLDGRLNRSEKHAPQSAGTTSGSCSRVSCLEGFCFSVRSVSHLCTHFLTLAFMESSNKLVPVCCARVRGGEGEVPPGFVWAAKFQKTQTTLA